VTFTLAHFSDLHLGPLPRSAAFHDFRFKRLVGALSWHLRRKHLHDPAVAEALMADIKASRPDHIAFTGDASNIASPLEFPQQRQWLERLGPPDQVSYVPGNHDAYVRVAYGKSLANFEAYMAGDMRLPAPFPYVRMRRNIALVGLNSAIPRPIHSAQGRLGPAQLAAIGPLLADLKAKGFYRVVMIHHPPIPGLASHFRGLIDSPALQDVLQREGADLVLYGHNHRRELHWLDGRIPLVGVASASMNANGHVPAEWNQFTITRLGGQWHTHMAIRKWQPGTGSFAPEADFPLVPP
jgi:3',5'-cyclic AMP phosphodiesterase CpdA